MNGDEVKLSDEVKLLNYSMRALEDCNHSLSNLYIYNIDKHLNSVTTLFREVEFPLNNTNYYAIP